MPAAYAQSPATPPPAGQEGPAGAGEPPANEKGRGGEGLKLPRYVSLRADEVNLRTGPGVRYPVEWVVQRKNMPVEVIAEFENWRKVRDWQGTEGWVHQSMLSSRRYMLIVGEVRSLRRRPEAGSPLVAKIEPGVVGQVFECKEIWCRVEAGGFKGWLARHEFWGVYPSETVK
ncbi:MAG: SH3 domain-containing protein [Rhodospirillales bacterium]|nr:SH3 domain-containing protein [Rhodospirillales bacterium]